MTHVAKFEKVSFVQFQMDAQRCEVPLSENKLLEAYQRLILPGRATAGSAGYDFYTPFGFALSTRESLTIPTGIRVKIEPGWFLALFPRSGHGFRYRLQLDNTVGIIDADYYGAENQGHILAKLSNDGLTGKTLEITAGSGFIQGIFLPYGLAADDAAEQIRSGGFGSTG